MPGSLQRQTCRGVRGGLTTPAARPLIELEVRRDNERVAVKARKPVVANFEASGQLMTSEVRFNTRSGPLETIYWMI